jgi:hypothetical protein
MMANTWRGEFPWQNLCTDGYERTSSVERFPPNGYGLYGMACNGREWTVDWFDRPAIAASPCCAPKAPAERFPRKVIKGRLAPVRAELLPPLQACGAPARGYRHDHLPHRLSLHRALSYSRASIAVASRFEIDAERAVDVDRNASLPVLIEANLDLRRPAPSGRRKFAFGPEPS